MESSGITNSYQLWEGLSSERDPSLDLISNMTYTYSEDGGYFQTGNASGIAKSLNISWTGRETLIQVLKKLLEFMEYHENSEK